MTRPAADAHGTGDTSNSNPLLQVVKRNLLSRAANGGLTRPEQSFPIPRRPPTVSNDPTSPSRAQPPRARPPGSAAAEKSLLSFSIVLNWLTVIPTPETLDSLPAAVPELQLLDAPTAGRRGRSARMRNEKGDKPVSVRDIAKLANVSVATVSMVLNDNPRISRATHLHVQRIMEKVGYRPNRLAQSLSSKYTQVMAIIIPALRHAFADAYFGEVISGVCDRAGKLGYKVILEQAKPEYIRTKQYIEIFERRYVDGVVCMGVNDRHGFLAEFADRKYPLIVVDNYFPQWDLDHVVCDYRGGADQAMNYLLQLGHRKIGMIFAAPDIRTVRDKIEVYESKLRSAGVEPVAAWKADGKFTEAGGAAACEQILSKNPDVTALFAANDKMAIGALHCLNRKRVPIPGRISVVGFDDMQHAAFANPALTTVHLPLYEVGALACERLIERIRGRVEKVAETLPTHLVVRESTGIASSFTERSATDG
jgi:LacI family transcriptional regulator